MMILIILIFLNIATAQSKTVFSIKMEIFKNDTVNIKEISVIEGVESVFPTIDTGYYVKIISITGEELFKNNLGVSFTTIFEPPIEDLDGRRKSMLIHIRLPYFDDAKRILIYHFDKKIKDIDLFNEICNKNGKCELGENELNCPIDCKIYKPICGNKICEAGENYNNCPSDCRKVEKAKKEFPLTYIIIFIILITILIILVLRKISKQKQGFNDWDEIYRR